MTHILKSLSSYPSESSVLLPSGESVRWMPILSCGKPAFRIGVLENGDWAVEDKAGLRHLDEQPSYLYVMALLEQPATSVRERLKAFFSDSDIGSVFPFANVVRAGLDQKSEYWADLAFRWLGEIPAEGRISLEDSVARIADAGWASQKLRQKAKKELKRLGHERLTAEKIYDQAMSLPNDSRRLLVERLVITENFPHPESSDNDNMTRKRYLIPIDEELVGRLTEISESKQIPPELLINSWIKEKISESRTQI